MAQDNSKKDIFMNAIATIAYSIIFIVSVSCIAIFIQYCITGFKDPVVPVEGLKFEESTIQVNSSNLDEAYLTVTATNELSEEILQQDGDYEDITVTLKIKNPEVLELEKYEVKLNEPVKIIPKLADDGYLVGGTCIVEANSNDGKWVVVENLTINVDVPIESITIKAENKIGQDVTQAINDKTIKFIKDDTYAAALYNNFDLSASPILRFFLAVSEFRSILRLIEFHDFLQFAFLLFFQFLFPYSQSDLILHTYSFPPYLCHRVSLPKSDGLL